MHAGRLVFAQLMDHLPKREFRACVSRYRGDYKVRRFSCLDQFYCLAFAQLTARRSLRDVVTSLRAMRPKLYHMGLRGAVSRSTLADANERRDWRIHAEFAHVLIEIARPLYAGETLGVDLDQTAYALDSTTIELCMSLFPWARFTKQRSALKLHTLLDLRGNIPVSVHVTPARVHDVHMLDSIIPEPGAFYIMDRAYLDFARLHSLHQAAAFFITRPRSDLRCRRLQSRPVEKSTGLRSDQTIGLHIYRSRRNYPDRLRRITYRDPGTHKPLTFLTNCFSLPALSIARLYKSRWQAELFFKWIKQHLEIQAFYGTSPNALKTQIWSAISTYLLVAILRKRLRTPLKLYTILQILSITLFEKVPIEQALTTTTSQTDQPHSPNQLLLFDL